MLRDHYDQSSSVLPGIHLLLNGRGDVKTFSAFYHPAMLYFVAQRIDFFFDAAQCLDIPKAKVIENRDSDLFSDFQRMEYTGRTAIALYRPIPMQGRVHRFLSADLLSDILAVVSHPHVSKVGAGQNLFEISAIIGGAQPGLFVLRRRLNLDFA
jgi:hypothetical protein